MPSSKTPTEQNENLQQPEVAALLASPYCSEPEPVVQLCHTSAYACATKRRCGKWPGIVAAATAQEASHQSPKYVVVQYSSALMRHPAPPTPTPTPPAPALAGVPTAGKAAQPIADTPTARGLGGNGPGSGRSSRGSSSGKTGRSSCGLNSKSWSNSRPS